ncbi:MAG: PIN domain-containing protein [Lachnospiraceae bacterium]|nr:PIN domain-containing protein [Lachnospiraceae bacterium]
MKLLIDTNVILDMVFHRKGCDDSMKLFRKIKDYGYVAYITASSVTDLFYITRKVLHDTKQTYAVMENIFKLVTVLSVTEKDIMDAFGQKWKDFEDCVQYMTGKNSGADFIITVNRGDFEDVLLPVRTPAEWLEEAGM